KEGKHMGPVHLGYRSVYRPDGTKILEPAPEAAPIIRRLFELAAAGNHSLNDLAGVGWDLGLRSRTGRKVQLATIHEMLHDPLYKGYILFDGILARGVHQAIVDEAVWDRVQDVLAARRTNAARPKNLTLLIVA